MAEPIMQLPASFDVVDDLLWKSAVGQLQSQPFIRLLRTGRIGPLVELGFAKSSHPAEYEKVRAPSFVGLVEEALDANTISGHRVGDVAGVFPLQQVDEEHRELREQWGMHLQHAAIQAGWPRPFAESMLGFLGEMEDNVVDHSGALDTGVSAYAVSTDAFEFVVADAGMGVLASLQKNPEFAPLLDAEQALRLIVTEGASRYPRTSGHGLGITRLYHAVMQLGGEVRLRSGGCAMTLQGAATGGDGQVLTIQKAWLNGLAVTVFCPAPRSLGPSS